MQRPKVSTPTVSSRPDFHHALTIRPMTAQDIPALAQLMAETPLWQRYGVTKTSARQRFQEGLAAGATILVAQVGSEQAGFLWYATRGAFLRSGYVVLLGVGAAWRGLGVGRALMARGEAAMFQEVDAVFLLVSHFNQAAQAFYRRLGYRQVGRLPGYVLPDVDELIFFKKRPAPGQG